MKYLNCNKCNKHLGQIEKGKLRKGTILICDDCKKMEILKNSVDTKMSSIFDFLGTRNK